MNLNTPTPLYRALIILLSPLIVGYTLWRSLRDGGKRYFLQRFGFGYAELATNTPSPTIWIHAASVGEVFTVLPLLKRINQPLLVTTMSPTGAKVLQQQQLAHVRHVFMPVDFSGACNRFIQKHSISQGWIVETEVWPWLYATAQAHSIPLTLINARLSARTSKQANGWLAPTYARALKPVTLLTRSEQDAKGYVALGASAQRTHVVGNMKYANASLDESLASNPSLIDRNYVLAASTHDNEELQLVTHWSEQQKRDSNGCLLVIVPRHPERGGAIVSALETAGIACVARSQNKAIALTCEVYIADTLGELQAWYEHAAACFVGGSLIERGGHNVLEPARAGCPIIVGPHMFNFDDIMQPMLNNNAIMVADNALQVIEFFNTALNNPEQYQPHALRAKQQAKHLEGVVDLYLEHLLPSH